MSTLQSKYGNANWSPYWNYIGIFLLAHLGIDKEEANADIICIQASIVSVRYQTKKMWRLKNLGELYIETISIKVVDNN